MKFFRPAQREPKILHYLGVALARALILSGGIGLAAYFSYDGPESFVNIVPAPTVEEKPDRIELAEALIEDHSCWTSETGTALPFPSRVVYSEGDSEKVSLGDLEVTEEALRQVFENEDHGLTIYAFCP